MTKRVYLTLKPTTTVRDVKNICNYLKREFDAKMCYEQYTDRNGGS